MEILARLLQGLVTVTGNHYHFLCVSPGKNSIQIYFQSSTLTINTVFAFQILNHNVIDRYEIMMQIMVFQTQNASAEEYDNLLPFLRFAK